MHSDTEILTHTVWAPALIVTIHLSAVLRADDGESYAQMLVSDRRLDTGQ